MTGLPVASRRRGRGRLAIRARHGALGAIVAVLVLAALRITRVGPLSQFAMQLESILFEANGTHEVTSANNNSAYHLRIGINDAQQRRSFQHGMVSNKSDSQNNYCNFTGFVKHKWNPKDSQQHQWKAFTVVQSTVRDKPSGFAARCDWVIGIRWQTHNVYGDFDTMPQTVFVNVANLSKFREYILPCIPVDHKFVMIIGDEDVTFPRQIDVRYQGYTFPPEHWEELLADPRIAHIFGSHLDVDDAPADRVTPIPLGFNAKEIAGKNPDTALPLQARAMANVTDRPLKILFTNRVRDDGKGQWADRGHAAKLCSQLEHCDEKHPDGPKFLEEVAKYPFVLSVHGGGIDPNPNLFMTLLGGSIPIIARFPSSYMYDGWPVVVTDGDWNATSPYFSKDFLEAKRRELAPWFAERVKRQLVLDRLGSKYWWAKVQKRLNRAPYDRGTTADALDAPTRNIADTTTNSSTSTDPATNWTDYFQRFVHNVATHWESSPSLPIPQMGAPESNPFAFQNFSETEQCKGSNDRAALRCLTPSFDGRTATLRTYERNDPQMRGILKFPRIDSNVRFHNRIAMLTNYFLGGALCNWLVEVPWGSIGTIRSTSFNCADFRDVLPRHNEATAAKCSKLARQRLSCHSWFRSSTLDPVVEGLHGDSILPGAILSARARNAYMGINIGPTIVAYLRGEDVFESMPHQEYGQPPLDYYVKSIEHAAQGRNAKVVVVSQDRKNPVVNAIEEHFRNSNSTTIAVVVRIGEPFNVVLRRIYCAEAVILAKSSMTMHVATGVNARSVYSGTNTEFMEKAEHGCADFSAVHMYERHGNYSVMDGKWNNTPAQREEMLTFHDGSLVRRHVNLFDMGVSLADGNYCGQ